MILPVFIYGHPVLRKKAEEVLKENDEIQALIADMFETMYSAKGVGLSAPQVGKPIRLFMVDAAPFADEEPECANFKKIFINPVISEFFGEDCTISEGCLSIPGMNENVIRKESIKMSYYDEKWKFYENEIFKGWPARIIQHEYDHLEGILLPDRFSPLKRRLLKNRLIAISKGKFEQNYKFELA